MIHQDEKWPLILSNLRKNEIENIVLTQDSTDLVWKRIYEILNISETYFFRDPNQLTAVFENILPEYWKRKAKKNLSIWSAGCSKGEEVYTLAILTEIFKKTHYADFNFSVLGTDLQETSIDFAKKGIYTPYSVRAGLPPLFENYLIQTNGEVQIQWQIKDRVQFRLGNLLNPILQSFDLIVCRNVLIYLDSDSKSKIVQNLANALEPNGILILGHSEYTGPLPRNLTLHAVANKTSYYVNSTNIDSTVIKEPVQKSKQPSIVPPQTNFPKSAPLPKNQVPKKKENEGSPLIQAREKKWAGEFESMVRLYEEAIYLDPTAIEAYYELASYYWETGNREKARKSQAQAQSLFKNDLTLSETLKDRGEWSTAWDEFLCHDL